MADDPRLDAALRDFDLGRAYAESLKKKGLTLDEAIAKAMKKLNLKPRSIETLNGSQQRQVYVEVIEATGRSRPSETARIPKLRWAARGLWIATFAVAAYNIGTAENRPWQTGREAASIAGGLGGSFTAGAAWGRPVVSGRGPWASRSEHLSAAFPAPCSRTTSTWRPRGPATR